MKYYFVIKSFYNFDNTKDEKLFLDDKYGEETVNKNNTVKKNDEYYTYVAAKCPICGYEMINLFYNKSFGAVFTKKNVGDFTHWPLSYGNISFSSRVYNCLEKYNIKGFKEIKKYNFVETLRHKPISFPDNTYYAGLLECENTKMYLNNLSERKLSEIERSKKFYDNLKKEREKNNTKINEPQIKHCDRCKNDPIHSFSYFEDQEEIYLDNYDNLTNDIFTILSEYSEIFVSERFKEMCEKEGFTNILERLHEVNDYKDFKK